MTPKMQEALSEWKDAVIPFAADDSEESLLADDLAAHMWNAAIEAAAKYFSDKAEVYRADAAARPETQVTWKYRASLRAQANVFDQYARDFLALKAQP